MTFEHKPKSMNTRLDRREHVLRHIIFLGNFGIAKAAIYCLPLAIAAFATASVYGAIELSLAIGLLVAGVSIAVPFGGITQRYLVMKDHDVSDLVWSALLAATLASAIFAALAWAWGHEVGFVVASCLSFAAIQSALSAWYRTTGQRNLAAWVDGYAVLAAAAGLGLAVVLGGGSELQMLGAIYAGFTVISVSVAAVKFSSSLRADTLQRMKQACVIGWPMMLVGAMSIWLGVGGRVVFGLTNPADLPAYSVAFRIAGLVLGLHQLVTIALFARLYVARTKPADSLLGLFIGLIAATSVVIAVGGPIFVGRLDVAAIDVGSRRLFGQMLPFACAHTLFWIGHAMLQARLNRYDLARKAIVPTALAMGIGGSIQLAVGLWLSNNAVLLSALIALQAAAYFAVNCRILFNARLGHRKVTIIGFLSGATLFMGGCFSALC